MAIIPPVRTRSTLSFGRGASQIEDLVAAAKMAGATSIGLTDRNTAAGHVRLAEACRKHAIAPIFGAEMAVKTTRHKPGAARTGWVSLLVQNLIGWRNLTRLLEKVTLGSQDAVPLEDLLDAQEGLVLLTGNRQDGLLPELAAAAPDQADAVLTQLRQAFGDRCYVEIERHPHSKRGSDIEAHLLSLAYNSSSACPIIATTPIWYATPDREEASRLLQAITAGQKVALTTDGRLDSSVDEEPGLALSDPANALALFADLPEAVRNAQDLVERCAYAPDFHGPRLPSLTLATKTPEDALRSACQAGLQKKLRQHPISLPQHVYEERLESELGIIQTTGFASYFLIVADFVGWARSRSIPVGPGRGSGVGSLAAWTLGITEIDPLRHGLLFERFLNPERVSLPDFDIDFCERRRGEVLHYVANRYGADRVAAISTFASIKLKSAVKDVARIVVHPDGTTLSFHEINTITKLLPSGPEEPAGLQEALERIPSLSKAFEQDPRMATVFRLAEQLRGLYRQTGLHAAGIIIADRPLSELAAVHPSPDAKTNKLPQLGLDMADAEKLGLVKFDFLGLSTTTLLDDAEQMLDAMGEARPAWPNLDRDDQKVLQAFAAAETFGIFQFESAGMRAALMDVKPTRFSDLVAINALFRPGPIKYIQDFAKRKSGEAEFAYPAPSEKTRPILQDTYGIMVYQEQVMEMARVCAGYSLGGADILRRAMGKKKPEEMIKQKKIFLHGDGKTIPGALALGMSQQDAERLFDDMTSFAGYGFNKSHAVAYTDLAWRAMWIKIHHPEIFYCALFNIHMSDTEKLSAIREDMRGRNIELLPPDIERSRDVFTVEMTSKGKLAIRFGLGGVRNLADLSDFLIRRQETLRRGVNALPRLVSDTLNSRQIENLAAAGAFDQWLPNRRQACEALLALKTSKAETAQPMLFDAEERDWRDMLPPALRDLPDWEDRQDREMRATGITLGTHPITANKDFLFQGGVRRLKSYLEFMRNRNMNTYRRAKLAFLVSSCASRTAGKSGGAMLAIGAAEENDRYEVFAFESSVKIPIDQIRTILETSAKLHEPVVATCDISVDRRTGKTFVKAEEIVPMNECILPLPGFYIAVLPAGKALPDNLMTSQPEEESSTHQLLVTWEDDSAPAHIIEAIGISGLASLLCLQDVVLRRVTKEEWSASAQERFEGSILVA